MDRELLTLAASPQADVRGIRNRTCGRRRGPGRWLESLPRNKIAGRSASIGIRAGQNPPMLRPYRLTPSILILACSLLSTACRKDDKGLDSADVVARERAAALFAQDQMRAARRELEPLLDRPSPEAFDLIGMTIIDFELPGADRALMQRRLERAIELDEDSAAAHFNLARLHYDSGRFEQALPHYRRARTLAPDDYPTLLRLASVLDDLADENDDEVMSAEALGLYENLIERGVAFGGSWHRTTLFKLFSYHTRRDEPDTARGYREENLQLEERGIPKPGTLDLLRGTFGVLEAPAPEGSSAHPRPDLTLGEIEAHAPGQDFRPGDLRSTQLDNRSHPVVAMDLDETPELPEGANPNTTVVDAFVSEESLTLTTPVSLIASPSPGATEVLLDQAIEAHVLFDLGEDRGERVPFTREGSYTRDIIQTDLELAFVRDGDLWLARPTGGSGAPRLVPDPEPILSGVGQVAELVATDLDHDGDLDLVAATDAGALFLRHDGADEAGGFTDASASLGVEPRAYGFVRVDDFDNDQDTDLLFGGPEGFHLASSLRRGNFEDRTAMLPDELSGARPPVIADFTADRFVDLFDPATGTLFENRFGERFAPRGAARGEIPPLANPAACDLDWDGARDLAWFDGQGRLCGHLALGLPEETELNPRPLGALVDSRPRVDGLGRLAFVAGDGLSSAELSGRDRAINLVLSGVKDNSNGVGAIVEIRAGASYQRHTYRGSPLSIGIGDAPAADVIRIRWPNGVSQSQLDVPAGEARVFEQIEGLVGSCPFLYAWNGETFGFVSDVLGITPLGLPIDVETFVPPDHDEYVLVTAEQLAERDGQYVLQFTEELREVTYLDQARLIAIDHPADSRILPNERFCFPPFPEEHLFVIERDLPPSAALDDQGRDWSEELSTVDERFAVPFVPHRGQYQGLANLHTLELQFDPSEVATAENLRLVLTGWFYWSNSSVNMAIARNPSREFLPPLLQVPDGQGGWRDTGPPVGFPAGKTKSMVLDLNGILNREDPRIRLVSTLRLYWDEIRLALCDDQGERRRTEAPLTGANLWRRGFSGRITPPNQPLLEWFDWDVLDPEPRWNPHPGDYTRYGDVLPLLESVEDQFVIMGAGDALEVTFDATEMPDLPAGWRRDFLLYLDGWAKDRDPNAAEVLYVEPLPFHAMSGYPYGEDEHFPDDPDSRAYRRTWNTRSAEPWIENLDEARR